MGNLIVFCIIFGIFAGIAILIHRRSIRKRIYRLTVLRLELRRLLKTNKLSTALYDQLVLQIETELIQSVDHLGVYPDSSKWRSLRNGGWDIIKSTYSFSGLPDSPPWEEASRAEKKPSRVSETQASAVPAPEPVVSSSVPPPLPMIKKPTAAIQIKPAPSKPVSLEDSLQKKSILPYASKESVTPSAAPTIEDEKKTLAPVSETRKTSGSPSVEFAWKPQAPKPIENVLQAISGWSHGFAPFLVQNIGWFISILSFVAGSIFLISYTAGFIRSLMIACFLFGYTLMMVFSAYQILRRRPELRASGSVLITIGMLMIPLSIASAVRLIDMNYPSAGISAAGFMVFMVNIGVFYWTAQLASGILSRTLLGLHTRLFMILSSIQIAAVFLSRTTEWVFAAAVHLILLIVLTVGIHRFIADWLKSIFVDRSRIAFFAAGTLIYAAVVSFVHCAWRVESLPDGYSGVFLMMISGLLFYTDSHFQKWTHRFPLLSRFTFGVYALSILSIVLSFSAYPARVISLILGAFVYAVVFWFYVSVPPLYLFMACAAALYHQVMLRYLPQDLFFLASLPGLLSLFHLSQWFLKRKGVKLAALMFRVLMGLSAGLIVFSLFHAAPGWAGFLTGSAAVMLFYGMLRRVPKEMIQGLGMPLRLDNLKQSVPDFLQTPLFYGLPVLSAVTLAYAPILIPTGWSVQFAAAMTIHAVFWSWAGFKSTAGRSSDPIPYSIGAMNVSILSIAVSIALAAADPNHFLLMIVLLLGGGILALQSIRFGIQILFYGFLVLEGAAGAWIKFIYFPGPSAGLAEMISAFIIFAVVWCLERKPEELVKLKRETAGILQESGRQRTILWVFPIRFTILSDVIKAPLLQAMVVLWAWSLARIAAFWITVGVSPAWVINAGLGTMMTLGLAARFGWFKYWSAPLGLGLAACLGFTRLAAGFHLSALSFTAAGYALVIWLAVRKLITTPLFLQCIRLLHFDKLTPDVLIDIEKRTHQTGLLITVGTGFIFFYWLAQRSISLIPAAAAIGCFFYLSTVNYRKQMDAYGLMASVIWISFILYVNLFVQFPAPVYPKFTADFYLNEILVTVSTLAHETMSGFLMSVLCVCMFGIERIISLKTSSVSFSQDQSDEDSFAVNLFQKPLCIFASLLAVCSGVQQIMIMILTNELQPLAVFILILNASGLFLSNIRLRIVYLNHAAVAMAVIAILTSETILFHYETAAAFFTFKQDQWITIAALSLILSYCSLILNEDQEKKRLYGVPVWQISALLFCLSMGKVIPSLFSAFLNLHIHADDPLFFLLVTATLFPMLKPIPYGVQLRGAGVLLFGTVIAVETAALLGVCQWSLSIGAVWAFVLWGSAEYGLPAFNRRYSGWAIDPTLWKWTGLALVLFNVIFKTLNSFDRLISFDPATAFSAFDVMSVIPASIYCAIMLVTHGGVFYVWAASVGIFITAFKVTGAAMDFLRLEESQWLNLAIISTGISAAARFTLTIKDKKQDLFSLTYVGAAGFGWAFIGSVLSMRSLFPFYADMTIGFACVVLFIGVFVLDITNSYWVLVRSTLSFLLLTASIFTFFPATTGTFFRKTAFALYPFAAWAIAEFVVPFFNQRFPKRSLDASVWIGMGFILVILIQPVASGTLPDILTYPLWLSIAVYLLLLMRDSANLVIPWAASGAGTLAVLTSVCPILSLVSFQDLGFCLAGSVLWATILLIGVRIWRQHGETIRLVLGWKSHDFENPIICCAALLTSLCLIRYIVLDVANLLSLFSFARWSSAHSWITIWISCTVVYLLTIRPHRSIAHLFLLSAFRLFISLSIPEPDDLCRMAFWTAVWSILLIVIQHFLKQKKAAAAQVCSSAMTVWITAFPWISLAALTLLPVKSLGESVVVLALLTGIITYLGRTRNQSGLQWAARILMLILIHTWLMMAVPSKKVSGLALWQIWSIIAAKLDQLQILLPWYSLQLMMIVFMIFGFRRIRLHRFGINLTLADLIPIRMKTIAVLGLCEWGLHVATFINKLHPMPPPDAWIHGIAAMASSCLMAAIAVRQIILTNKVKWVYGVILLIGAMGVYIRLVIAGVKPPGIWDTTALIGSAAIFLLILRTTHYSLLKKPLTQTIFILPLLALTTVPLHLESPYAATALTAGGALYLSLHYSTGRASLFYLAFAMINAALYLWIPLWAQRYSLIQLYVVPMAVSVLIMLQLHKKELRRSVLNGSRLAALSALYTSALADVFLRPDVGIFVLALLLSLAGAALGIAMRVRAFLYGGAVFLVLNIIGQLIRFYPEDRLGKGIALIVLGAAMLAMMIWFNVKRETILKQVRLVRSDLELWE